MNGFFRYGLAPPITRNDISSFWFYDAHGPAVALFPVLEKQHAPTQERSRATTKDELRKRSGKEQADLLFRLTKSQWNSTARTFIDSNWSAGFIRHETGVQVIGFEPLRRFGVSLQPIYENAVDGPLMLIVGNYLPSARVRAMTEVSKYHIKTMAQQALGRVYDVKVSSTKIENFEVVEFMLRRGGERNSRQVSPLLRLPASAGANR